MVKQWKLERNRRLAAAQQAKADNPGPGPWPVFFCVKTGDKFVTSRWWCREEGCTGEVRETVGRFKEGEDVPWPDETRPCPVCGKAMERSAQSHPPIYKRFDTGEELNPNGEKLPPGAVWAYDDVDENKRFYGVGPDGRSLWCVLPDGHTWCIDGQANNCTHKEDKVHKCWVRTGRPEDGTLHVSKGSGKMPETCQAGAGSIMTSRFHGFLHVRNGRSELYSC